MRKAGGYQSHTQNVPHPSKTEQLANYRTLQYIRTFSTLDNVPPKRINGRTYYSGVCVSPPHPTAQ